MKLSGLDPSVLLNIPIAAPPPGVTSNFINPVSRASQTRLAIYVTNPIMLIILVLRLYTRLRITRNIGYDDYVAIAAAICVMSYSGLLLWMLQYPLGLHTWDVPISRLTTAFIKENLASLCLAALANMLVKSALLALYLRIFRPSLRANIMIWIGFATVILFYLSTSVANIILFVPRHGGDAGWIMSTSTVTMILNIADTQGVVGCLQDIYILVIPLHLVSGLSLPLRRKIGVSALFVTGLLATICAIVANVYRFNERRTANPDTLWDGIPVFTLSTIELNVGIMCSCLPTIMVMFKDIMKSTLVLSFRRYIRSYPPSEGSGSGTEKMHAKSTNGLPKVPNGTLNGLKTFFGRFQQTQNPQETYQDDISTFSQLESKDESYHEILRANHATKQSLC